MVEMFINAAKQYTDRAKSKYLHQKNSSNLKVIYHPLADQNQPKRQPSHFTAAIKKPLNLQPEQEELSIFDSAWTTLKGDP